MFSGDNLNESFRKQRFIYKMKKRRDKGLKEPRPCPEKPGFVRHGFIPSQN